MATFHSFFNRLAACSRDSSLCVTRLRNAAINTNSSIHTKTSSDCKLSSGANMYKQCRQLNTGHFLNKRGSQNTPRHSSQETPNENQDVSQMHDILDNSTAATDDAPQQQDKKLLLWEEGPYPTNSQFERSQSKYSYRPTTDPSMTSVVLFPGQGTQYVGMGRQLLDIPSVQDMYDAASEILGFNLLKACLEGPHDFLARTQVQQPAILVSSLAAVEKLRHEEPAALESCVATAGFSVGEITALAFAGALSFEDAVQLIKVRAEAMQLAAEQVAGGMVTVMYGAQSRLGLSCDTAKEYCKKRGVQAAECRVASYLGPNCKVVAGSEEALQFLQDHKHDFKLLRLTRLNVSGAFHTSHMEPAAEVLVEALKHIQLDAPSIPVHSNIDGKPYRNPKQIRKNLPLQMCRPVKWEQTMHTIYERPNDTAYPRTFECGPGESLKTILKMNNAKAMASTVNFNA